MGLLKKLVTTPQGLLIAFGIVAVIVFLALWQQETFEIGMLTSLGIGIGAGVATMVGLVVWKVKGGRSPPGAAGGFVPFVPATAAPPL